MRVIERAPVRRVAQVITIGFVGALLALLVWKVIAGRSGVGFVADIRAGNRPAAPPFDLPVIWNRAETWPRELRRALDDERLSLDEVRGYPVVINFWASWCVPCKAEAPHLAASARANAGRVVFLAIDVQDFVGDARRFMREVDAPYVSVRDGNNATFQDYGLTGVPETFYIDEEGRAVAHSIGEISRDDLDRDVALLLDER